MGVDAAAFRCVIYRGGPVMRVVQVYYDATGPWGNWGQAIEQELTRLRLTADERKRVTIICTPESMRKKFTIKHQNKKGGI